MPPLFVRNNQPRLGQIYFGVCRRCFNPDLFATSAPAENLNAVFDDDDVNFVNKTESRVICVAVGQNWTVGLRFMRLTTIAHNTLSSPRAHYESKCSRKKIKSFFRNSSVGVHFVYHASEVSGMLISSCVAVRSDVTLKLFAFSCFIEGKERKKE